MADNTIHEILLDEIKVQKNNVRRHDIDVGIEDLAVNIKANGLLQPITAFYDSKKEIYVILTGQRRLNAHHYLNEKYPGDGFDKIKCVLIDEPESDTKKMSLSLAENITQLPMTNTDLIKAVTDLYNTYNDYDLVQKEFGLSQYMVKKYVQLARLPDDVKSAVNNGEIHSNPKTAENMALKAVDALQYTKGGSIPTKKVIEFAKELAKGEIDTGALVSEAPKGGSLEEMKSRASKKSKKDLKIELSTEVDEKLSKVAESKGETKKGRATYYVTEGATKDYAELD